MLKIDNLTIVHRRDLRTILSGFSLILNRGDKAVLIGEEGNGKSTLLKWICDPRLVEGYAEAEGTQTTQGELLGYLPQELSAEEKEKTVCEYCMDLPAFQEADAAEVRRTAAELRLPEDIFWSDQTMGSLSGGERVKLQMAGVLLARPDVLLLDEPSNDIDIDTLLWLEELINGFPGAVLYISHDETLIERTANRVILIEHLRKKTVPRVTVANVPYRTFAEERQRAFAKQEQEAVSERREEKKAMERFRRIEQAVEQGQRNISRRDPHGGRLLKKKMKAVRSLERRFEREHGEMTEFPEEESAIAIRFDRQKAMPAGKTVLEISVPELNSPSGEFLARNVFLKVRGPEKICIIGSNGSGKTTLIRKIAEELCARTDITACYMPQDYEEALTYDMTQVDYLAPSGKKEEVTTARTYLGAMRYTAEEMFHPVGELSGGQKAKLLLLKISLTETDVLILDEPTRNLSPLSGPEIRGILKGFPGAIISVSHDRKYMTEVCDKIYRLAPDGLTLLDRELN